MSALPPNWFEQLLQHGKKAGLDGKTIYLVILSALATILMLAGRSFFEAVGLLLIAYLLPPVHRAYEVRKKRDRMRDKMEYERERNRVMLEGFRGRAREREPRLPFEPPSPSGVDGTREEGGRHDRD
jgi:hypothetical protein